jgi:uncharacterized protein (DUF2126 family)
MYDDQNAFEQAVRAHDETVAHHDIPIWVGSEPTFTDRFSEAPEWLTDALGPGKEARACTMLADLYQRFPDGLILRTLGRQYAEETAPRWSLGLYRRRDGQPFWSGPPDPLLCSDAGPAPASKPFWKALAEGLTARGWSVIRYKVKAFPHRRLLFRTDGQVLPANLLQDPRLARPSVHSQPIPREGMRDPLAEEGLYLIGVDLQAEDSAATPALCLELPAFSEVEPFLALLTLVAQAASDAQLDRLILSGYPPPVDARISWTTLTPDPAVVEVNLAPATDVQTFLAWSREVYALAETAGLSSYRLHYNGQLAGSGGGGQFTLGGPTPLQSPFLRYPQLLPALVRYVNQHPALSYYFAPDFVGGTSQSPRPDEGTAESFAELALALNLLDRQGEITPEVLWGSLAPFLTDLSGNTHRSELNIEKLWNPYLPGRGRLGVVEFRAFQMPPTPERAAALAALLRAIVLLLIRHGTETELVRWQGELHDRFALPFHLRGDLWAVLDDLERAGLGLGPPLLEPLLDDSYYALATTDFGDCRISLRRALEFWPLVGDTASQEHGGSRLVDASTGRIEVCLRPLAVGALDGWSLSVDGYRVPLPEAQDRDGPARVIGLRYRRFQPWRGLHPTLAAHGPLALTFSNPRHAEALRLTLHEWKPQGGGYDGLPADGAEAARRRQERCVVETVPATSVGAALAPPAPALTPHCLDLRWL